jgi:WD40 repeat protein
MSGPVFSQDVDNIEFSPKIPHPTSYTKVKSRNKRNRELDRLFLAQELRWHNDKLEKTDTKVSSKSEKPDKDAIWALSFSTDGKYLAAGGESKSVKLWSVLSNEEDREVQEMEENDYPNPAVQMRAPIFNSTPVQTYTDHDGAILDLQWSKVSYSTIFNDEY